MQPVIQEITIQLLVIKLYLTTRVVVIIQLLVKMPSLIIPLVIIMSLSVMMREVAKQQAAIVLFSDILQKQIREHSLMPQPLDTRLPRAEVMKFALVMDPLPK